MDKVVSEVDGATTKTKTKKKKSFNEEEVQRTKADEAEYTEGPSDSEFVVALNDLKPQHKLSRIMYLWRKVYTRTRGGARISTIFKNLHRKVVRHGSTRNLLSEEKN